MKSFQLFIATIILQLCLTSPATAQGLLGDIGLGAPAATAENQASPALAQSPYGNLTSDGANAYVEALEFCLQQIGQTGQFSPADKQQIIQALTVNFPTLPPETQQALSIARTTWDQYRNNWPMLSMDQKVEFAYDVFSLAYGEQAAAQALGLNTGAGQGGSGGSGDSGFSQPCYQCTEEGSMIYGGAIDMGGGEFSY